MYLFHFLSEIIVTAQQLPTDSPLLIYKSRFSYLPDIYHKEGEKSLLASIMYPKYSKHLSSGIQNGLLLQ